MTPKITVIIIGLIILLVTIAGALATTIPMNITINGSQGIIADGFNNVSVNLATNGTMNFVWTVNDSLFANRTQNVNFTSYAYYYANFTNNISVNATCQGDTINISVAAPDFSKMPPAVCTPVTDCGNTTVVNDYAPLKDAINQSSQDMKTTGIYLGAGLIIAVLVFILLPRFLSGRNQSVRNTTVIGPQPGQPPTSNEEIFK